MRCASLIGLNAEASAPAKLAMLRERAAQEREHMLLFNFFLRLTPFAPNWFINVASPVCGIPLTPFFVGSLFGTQLSLLFLALTGATLREAGESNFELGDEFLRNGVYLGLTMGVLRKRFFSVDESTGGFSLERFSVKAPAWAKPGDTIEIEAGTSGLRYMVTVPSSAGPGESFEVDGFR